MRKANREIKEFDKIVNLVERCDTIRLGISNEPSPYIVPLSFGYEIADEKIVFYVHGARKGKRHELVAKNPRVCVEGDLCHGFMGTGRGSVTCEYESFIGYGNAELVKGEEAKKGIDLILSHCGFPGYPYKPGVFKVMSVYKIVLDEVRGKHRNL